MKNIIKIAWRNIWRNKVRSAIVITSVALGTWALIFILGFYTGMINNYVNSAIIHNTSHIQIHNTAWLMDPLVENYIPFNKKRTAFLLHSDSIQAFSKRLIVNGTASSARGTRVIQVYGVKLQIEDETTDLLSDIIASANGFHSDTLTDRQVILGIDLAEDLKLEVGSKLVVNFAAAGGDLKSSAFRIAAIYDSGNKILDGRRIYISKQKLAELMGIDPANSHEIAILLKAKSYTPSIQSYLKEQVDDDVVVQNYEEINPSLALIGSQMYVALGVMVVIVLLALIFGIVNTMLMVILERTRELGMLMAIGMNKLRIFLMIVYETLFLSLLGAPIGVFLGWLCILYFGYAGFDLSFFADGLKKYGLSSIVYPELDTSTYIYVAISLVVMALIASIYPSVRAIKLNPVEAIRKM